MSPLATQRIAQTPRWAKDELWRRARAVPSLDLRFADNKSLVDATTGQNLVDFSRASGGTYVDSQGVIRNATTNLLLRSEEFDNASWTKLGTTVTPNAGQSPSGATTADLLEVTASGGSKSLYLPVTALTSSTAYSISFYVKAATSSSVVIGVLSGGSWLGLYSFTLSGNGATTPIIAGVNSAITNNGNGWYRCQLTVLTTGTSFDLLLYPNTTGNSIGNSVYLWGAQLEQSSTVGEYLPTTSTINSAPRFDHNPTTGESLGLLVEEARTNSIRNNTMVGAVAGTPGTLPTNWVYAVAGTGITREIVGTGVDNGINYIDFRFSGTSGSTNVVSLGIDRAAALTTQSWTASLYWKLVAGSTSGVTGWQLGLIEETSANAFVAGAYYTVTTPTASLSRVSASRTLSGGATVANVLMPVLISCTNGVAIDFTLRIGMPQLEQGAFATSVIPTSGAAATRAADVASITGTNFSSWYRQDEGTVFADARVIATTSGTNRIIQLGGATTADRQDLFFSGGVLTAFVNVNGVAQVNAITSNSISANQDARSGYSYKQNDFSWMLNAGPIKTDDSGTLPAVDKAGIGVRLDAAGHLNGHLRRLAFWPQRLGNEVLQRITQ